MLYFSDSLRRLNRCFSLRPSTISRPEIQNLFWQLELQLLSVEWSKFTLSAFAEFFDWITSFIINLFLIWEKRFGVSEHSELHTDRRFNLVRMCERDWCTRKAKRPASIKSALPRWFVISSALTLNGAVRDHNNVYDNNTDFRTVPNNFEASPRNFYNFHQYEAQLYRTEFQSRDYSGSYRLLRVARRLVSEKNVAN